MPSNISDDKMTNHIHLVIEPSSKGRELYQIMKGINLSYAQHFKNKYKYTGHFWQDRFRSIIPRLNIS